MKHVNSSLMITEKEAASTDKAIQVQEVSHFLLIHRLNLSKSLDIQWLNTTLRLESYFTAF